MTKPCHCAYCPIFRRLCEGCTWGCRYQDCDGECGVCPVRCHRRHDLDEHLSSTGGLDLDLPLRPQPAIQMGRYIPQLLNNMEISSPLHNVSDIAVGVAKALTPSGKISHRAMPHRPGPRNLRVQWRLDENARLICIGNDQDHVLEKLWTAQLRTGTWLQVQLLGFNLATSLNFSIYLDEPRLEHLISIKRTWITIARMQQTSRLTPIPHLQWGTLFDAERQLDYARASGFHTLALNVQMAKRQAWDVVVEPGLYLIQDHAPDLRLLFTGVAGLKRLASLAQAFPWASFTSSTPHFLAQRYIRLRRDGTRLIKEPVDGHPDLILAENVRLFDEFLAEQGRVEPPAPRAQPAPERDLVTAYHQITALLQERLGQSAADAAATAHRLAADQATLQACRAWLYTGTLDYGFGGSFSAWPCAEKVPHPTVGQLLAAGLDPLPAFLHLAGLAEQVDAAIAILAGEAGL